MNLSPKQAVLEGVRLGRPLMGPQTVHIDITNGCNAACVTCWDHSPLLTEPRSNAWKRRRMSLADFQDLLAQLDALGSVRAIILSGMGDPLTHPHVLPMIAAVKERGWRLTVLSNLVAATQEFVDSGVDEVLVGVQGATPDAYMAFHPGWTEREFSRMCGMLRKLGRAGVRTKHVQVINRDTAGELVEMVRFGKLFRAARVNFKLASLYGGTEACSITAEQRDWLRDEGIPRARELAEALDVVTNLELFEAQIQAACRDLRHTTDMAAIGCFMGFVYTRVTVDREVLYCCNTHVRVGSLAEASLSELWSGQRWQALRAAVAGGRFFAGCEVCGKVEQNRKWAERLAQADSTRPPS